jgi:hypothetical protein
VVQQEFGNEFQASQFVDLGTFEVMVNLMEEMDPEFRTVT